MASERNPAYEDKLMATDIIMPQLTDLMEEGTIVRWLKHVGEQVGVDDDLVEIDTDKAVAIYQSDVEGVLIAILKPEGTTVPVGEVIAHVGDPSDAQVGEETTLETHVPQALKTPERVDASPLVRRIAEERGIDLRGIEGSGPGGRIVRADLDAASTAATRVDAAVRVSTESQKQDSRIADLTRAQSAMAQRMAEAKATVPHFYLTTHADMTAVTEERRRGGDDRPNQAVPPTLTDLVIGACALALREHPRANASYRGGKLELHARINVGVAVATDHSVIVPVIPDADKKTIDEISTMSRELSQRAVSGEILLEEISGGTFTVSNLGMYGVDSVTAVINPPEAAILGVGALRKVPRFTDLGDIVAHEILTLTLSCDHRALSGADAALFLARIRELLEQSPTPGA